jgi:hypothetical protein
MELTIYALEILERLPPEIIEALKKEEQSPDWHAEGSVYNHVVMVIEELLKHGASKDLLVAGALHDLGKLDTVTITMDTNGKQHIHHYGHEIASMKYIDKLLPLWYDYKVDEKVVKEVIFNHMKAHLYRNYKMSNKFKRKAFEENPYFKEIMLFETCDNLGSIKGEM